MKTNTLRRQLVKAIRTLLGRLGFLLVRKESAVTGVELGLDIQDAVSHNRAENADQVYASPERVQGYLDLARRDFYDELAAHFQPAPGQKVLDLGCGPAHLLRVLRERVKIEPWALDQSSTIRAYVEKTVPGVRYTVGDIFATGYAHSQFDWIFLTEVLEHLLHPAPAIDEALRILKPGGFLVITVPNGRQDTFAGHINFWSPESLDIFLEPYTVVQSATLGGSDLLRVLTRAPKQP